MKIAVKFLFFLLFFFSLLHSGEPKDRDANVTLQLDWIVQYEFAGFVAAKEKGFYHEAGLNVTIRPYKKGTDVVREVLAGRADYGVYSSKLQKLFVEGTPVKLVASFFKKPSKVLVTHRGMKKPEDLLGKTIQVNSRKDFFLEFGDMFRKRGISPADLKLIEKPILSRKDLQPFIDGKVDAIVLFVTSGLYPLDRLGVPYEILDPTRYGDYSVQQELFASKRQIEKFPDRTLAFRNATIKGWYYALDHPEEIARIIHEKYAPNKSVEELLYEATLVRRLILPSFYRIGSFDKHLIRAMFKKLIPGAGESEIDRLVERYLYGNGSDMSPLVLSPTEREYLKKHPVIKVHNESNWPPFNFIENGKAKGFAVDYFKLLAERIGARVEFVQGYTWNDFLSLVHTNKLDVIINLAVTPKRRKAYAFTLPYIDLKSAIYTNLNKKSYSTLQELEGKKVALVKGFFIQKYLAKYYPKIRQVLVPDQLQALKLLSLGKVDAVVGKQVVIDYLLRHHLLANIYATSYVKDPRAVSHLSLGLDKKDVILASILRKAQKTITPPEMEYLRHKWFGINPLLETRQLLNTEEKTYLAKKKKISVCIEPDRAPFGFVQDGKPQGIAVDVITMLARKLDLKPVFHVVHDTENLPKMLQKRECDIVPGALEDSQNFGLLLFSSAYLDYPSVLVVPESNRQSSEEILHVSGKRIAARWGDPLVDRLAATRPTLKVVYYDSYPEVLEAVSRGEVPLAILPKPVFDYYRSFGIPGGRKKQRIWIAKGLKIGAEAPVKTEISLAVRKDETKLFEILEKVLQGIPHEVFTAISESWTQGRVTTRIDYRLLAQIVGVALLMILMILLAYLRQRKLNRKIAELNNTLEERVQEAVEENRKQLLWMQQHDRLAKMGELIAMIAHQWRQPLNNLSLVQQLFVSKCKQGTLDEKDVEHFRKNSRRLIEQMSATIDDFRSFYKTAKESEEFTIRETVETVLGIVRMGFTHARIDVAFHAERDYRVVGYPNELAHVLLNLLSNARDAFEEREIEHRRIDIALSGTEDEAIIRICDNAGGIPEELLGRVFEPYFSTKEEKNGTGLGLYMARMILTEHMNGTIEVENEDEGACFTIRLKGAVPDDTE